MKLSFRRKKRKDDLGLAKYIFLSDKQLIFQLITAPGNPEILSTLEKSYKQIESLNIERMGALRAYILIMTVGILSKFNLLNQFNSLGFGISPNALSHVVLISLAFFSFRLAVIYSKFYYIANIFDVFFYKSDPPRRALLLAEYPLAFEVIKFYQGQIGTLPHTARMKLPYRMLGMLIFLVTGIIAYLGFSIYIYCSLASTVWNSSGGLPTFWSHALFVISTSLMICSWLLPFDLMIKKSYMHIGFIKMLNAAHELDLERYRRYFEWTRRIRKPDQRL